MADAGRRGGTGRRAWHVGLVRRHAPSLAGYARSGARRAGGKRARRMPWYAVLDQHRWIAGAAIGLVVPALVGGVIFMTAERPWHALANACEVTRCAGGAPRTAGGQPGSSQPGGSTRHSRHHVLASPS